LLTDYSLDSDSLSANNENPLILLSPHPNAIYRIDPNFDPSAQQLEIEVAVGQGITQVEIWVDGTLLATLSSPPYQAWWTLSAGEHRFWAEGVDVSGEGVKSEIVTITVGN
jgi:hypothetical protein